MNEESIKKTMFGAQAQAGRQLDAVVKFVAEYMNDRKYGDITEALIHEAHKCAEKQSASSEEEMFLRLFLGVDGAQAAILDPNVRIEKHFVGNNGKIVYDVISDFKAQAAEVPDYDVVGEKEDSAYDLVKEILALCPPSERKNLPEDDTLAALLLSKSYYKSTGEL